ncbi:MAG: dephospho-CoA kinase [Gammaproteobacteria bacterium]|nr:dephospho-CoA kinase [Gammaproteobacteria bacterium]
MSTPDDASSRPLFVGLTGGIASGKSAVSEAFAALGVTIVDTDVIAREVVAPGSPALEEIRGQFGHEVFAADGSLDRARMRELVFADAARRRQLEAILHPRIRAETLRRAAAATTPYVLIVVPLMVETGFDRLVDRVIVVDAPEAVQRERLMARDAHDEAQAQRILDSQADRQTRLARADDVISNAGALADTQAQVVRLHERLLEAAAQRPQRPPGADSVM